MLEKNLKPLFAEFFLVLAILLIAFVASSNLASASGGSISQANIYPENGYTYSAIGHFTYQIIAVNTNTTISVSIDSGSIVPVAFEGINNKIANNETGSNEWYTWQVTIPAITSPGNHTYQFFSHYYVWLDTDQYWAEFNARSIVNSFTIVALNSNHPTLAPTSTAVPQQQTIPELLSWILLSLIGASKLIVSAFVRRRLLQK